jgi:hypothetical protein
MAIYVAPTMLEGAFDVTPRGMVWVSLAVFFLCFSLKLLGTIVVAYGPRRMGLKRTKWVCSIRKPAGWSSYAPWILLGLPMILLCLNVSATTDGLFAPGSQIDWNKLSKLVAAAGLGLVGALVLFLAILLLHRTGIQDAGPAKDNLYSDPTSPKWLARKFKHAESTTPWPWLVWIPLLIGSVTTWLFGRQGYYNKQTGRLKSGHRLSIIMALALILLYWGMFILPHFDTPVPVLVYLTILVLLAVWLLNALAFALDRYRIPVVLPVVAIILVSHFTHSSVYSFRSTTVPPPTADHPANSQVSEAADLLSRDDVDGCPVIVAAEGGGIHSGAWATQVLGLLEQNCRAEGLGSFSKRVVCVSGVSGGSYGLMYWVNSYGLEGGPNMDSYNPKTTAAITREMAMRSSLTAVIKGLVYHDIWQSFGPLSLWASGSDRGSVMEEVWAKSAKGYPETDNLAYATLGKWRTDTIAKKRPAILFNSMNADTGQPVVFTTTSLGSRTDRTNWEYCCQRPNDEVNIATAARCSSSFPYVCPAATPSSDRLCSMHLVDGGYFDNYGMATLNRWLKLAVETYEREAQLPGNPVHPLPKRLLVVQIRGSNASLFPQTLNPEWREKKNAAFLYQAQAPLLGLINMRQAAQTWHNDQEYELLVRRLKDLGIDVTTAVFRFPSSSNPLSWHLTSNQQQAIRSVNFAAVDAKVPSQLDRVHEPKSPDEWREWRNWTRQVSQLSLQQSWEAVAKHFSQNQLAPTAKKDSKAEGSASR